VLNPKKFFSSLLAIKIGSERRQWSTTGSKKDSCRVAMIQGKFGILPRTSTETPQKNRSNLQTTNAYTVRIFEILFDLEKKRKGIVIT
jgi:hypothetical protein